MKKPKRFYTFLYRHFRSNGHSPNKIVIQPVEKIMYDPNSSTRLKNIKRHETQLKWIIFLQLSLLLGFNDNIYHESNISKMQWLIFIFSSLPSSVLRNLELEANNLYDRANKFYKAALLTRCYVQHLLSPYIDSEVNHKQHLIKIPFISKGIEFID